MAFTKVRFWRVEELLTWRLVAVTPWRVVEPRAKMLPKVPRPVAVKPLETVTFALPSMARAAVEEVAKVVGEAVAM